MPALDKRKADKPVENVLDQSAKPHYLTTASKPPKRFHGGSASAYGSFRTAAGTNQENIAKLVQDEFNRTHSKRLSKLPSFLSTHMSKFNSSMNTITVGFPLTFRAVSTAGLK
jgi:hypothetical protein